VLEPDAVEDAPDRGLRVDRREGALPGTVGLREDALQVVVAGSKISAMSFRMATRFSRRK
jgi:hypothetical protein